MIIPIAELALRQFAAFLSFDAHATVEWIVEMVGQAVIFLGLSMVLFRLNRRDTLTLGVVTAIIFLLMWLGAWIIRGA